MNSPEIAVRTEEEAAAPHTEGNEEAEEIRRLKEELVRVTKEHDILRKAAAHFARDAKEK